MLAYDHHNETIYHAVSCIMQLFGSVSLGGLLGYVFFHPSFEKFLHFVPFKKQWMVMPIRLNMFLLGLLTILGSISMCLGPVILVSEIATNIDLTTYILTKFIPVALMATALGSSAYNIFMGHVTDHIREITDTPTCWPRETTASSG